MILIFSEEGDQSTNFVIDWLRFQNSSFVRINTQDIIEIDNLTISEGKISFVFTKNKEFKIDSNDIQSIWFRRGNLNFNSFLKNISTNPKYNHFLSQNLKLESKALNEFILKSLEDIRHVGDSNYETSKLLNLTLAQKAGLKTPKTSIVSNKRNLKECLSSSEVINKSLQKSIMIDLNTDTLVNYTSEISRESVDQLPSSFFPSLIQEKIKKKFELRIFVLEQAIYSMAIFSQFNEQTQVDFRKYDHIKPNRRVPFDLPKNIKGKILNFMKLAKLTTGSIDMVVNENDDYVFLEVNPVGQFDMVTVPCNYYLYKEIASKLG